MSYEKLKATLSPWDSEVFGFKVGTLLANNGTIPTHFVAEANKGDFDVVFVKANGWHEEKKGRIALDWRFDMEVKKPLHRTVGEASVTPLEGPHPSHITIAQNAFADSRFYRDPQLAEKVPEFYRRWLMNRNAQIWALQGAQGEDGFLQTIQDEDDVPRISLIGVGAQYRGLGIGERLIIGVMERFPSAKAWRVMATVRNWRALRFYEGLGFRIKSVSTVFHVWMG